MIGAKLRPLFRHSFPSSSPTNTRQQQQQRRQQPSRGNLAAVKRLVENLAEACAPGRLDGYDGIGGGGERAGGGGSGGFPGLSLTRSVNLCEKAQRGGGGSTAGVSGLVEACAALHMHLLEWIAIVTGCAVGAPAPKRDLEGAVGSVVDSGGAGGGGGSGGACALGVSSSLRSEAAAVASPRSEGDDSPGVAKVLSGGCFLFFVTVRLFWCVIVVFCFGWLVVLVVCVRYCTVALVYFCAPCRLEVLMVMQLV